MAHRNGNAARAGAQVEGASHFAAAQPGLEASFDQFGDRRTRHQGARIALETQAGKPGLAGEVRRRNALGDAALEQAKHLLFFRTQQARLAIGRAEVVRQMQGVQDHLGGFVQRIVVAVAECQAGCVETAGAVADQVDDGVQFVGRGGSHGNN